MIDKSKTPRADRVRFPYSPGAQGLTCTFHNLLPAFAAGTDTPRKFLERCLASIDLREPVLQAWVYINREGARTAADASTARWKDGRALSPIDGMPIGIKDVLETFDMPTQMGCDAFRDNFTYRDSALVQALRESGAVVLGKTVTSELAMSQPGLTTNPFDSDHTPGGSSSGSAAAVGAQTIPAAIGTQVGGSIIRPASFCGNLSLKPTQGAINRGPDQLGLSQCTAGVLANSIEDMWNVAKAITLRVGGDPGYPGLFGPLAPPKPAAPTKLIFMQSSAWKLLDDRAIGAFESVLWQLERAGIEILRREDHPLIEAFEQSIEDASALTSAICGFEDSPMLRSLLERAPDGMSERLKRRYAAGSTVTLDDYRARLSQRDFARKSMSALAHLADALIAPASIGPAPTWVGDAAGGALVHRPTGDFAYNAATSALGVPAVTVPLTAVGGMPMGIQIIGQQQQDANVTSCAQWMLQNLEPVFA